MEVRGLQDLPPEALASLLKSVRIERLGLEEEASFFAVALVISGWVRVLPAIADLACAVASQGQIVFTVGSLEEGVELRLSAGQDETLVALWDRAALDAAIADCPWVAEELRSVADGFQALAGASMGPLSDHLDETLLRMVTERCTVKVLQPGDVVCQQGKAVPGMHIVGAGRLELVDGDVVVGELGPGEILFGSEILSAAPAPRTARAGRGGALVLVASRMAAHELMMSVPPLLELLAM